MARAYLNYAQSVTSTPQTQPIPGREAEMVENNAGGFGFVLDDWERLNRFLILGSDGGTYYVSEKNLTAQNAAVVIRCIKADGPRVVAAALDVNVNNRAPKTDPQLFALVLCMAHGDDATKTAVRAAAPQVLRTGTHLLHFVAMLDSLGGWNRSKRRVIADWFGQQPDRLAYQMLKYQNRDGWTMRDALRVTHPDPLTEQHDAIFAWACGKVTENEALFLPDILAKHTHMLAADDLTPVQKALWGIGNGLPREALPTEALTNLFVQRALLPQTPIHALIRNLGNWTASGLLTDSEMVALAATKIVDKGALRKARVHPFAILLATLVYRSGAGFRGSKTWVPQKQILSALEDAYDLAFDYVEPSNKRILIGVDVSGSMHAACVGTPVFASTAAAAMALTLARMEPHATVVRFDTQVRDVVAITKRSGIASIESRHGGGTDLTAPLRWAGSCKAPYDAVILLTDNETWAGSGHPAQMLQTYRRAVGLPVKLICCAMAANHANVVDPADPLQFGCAGLDAHLPSLVADFIGRDVKNPVDEKRKKK